MYAFTQPKPAAQLMQDNLLVKHYAGSIAYGTNLPTSDVDFRGIFTADPVNVLSPFYPVREVNDKEEEDTKIYELWHFMKLAVDCNPNIVETLWVDESSITFSTPAYEHLRAHRHQLLSGKIAFTTSGYAMAQLKRIRGHNKWINNPQPEERPQHVDFVSLVLNNTPARVFKINLRDYERGHRLVPLGGNIFGLYIADGYSPFNPKTGALNTDYEGDFHENNTPQFIVKFNEEQYRATVENWSNYWTWKKNRNASRSVLEEQFGFDTKHAMHLVRLLRMGAEVLETGELHVLRPDAQELLDIRAGVWSYERVVEYAEYLDNHVKTVLLPKTSLPRKPNLQLAARLTMEAQSMVWDK